MKINLEEFLLREEKLSDIIEDLSSDATNSCYEWWNFIMNSSATGKLEMYFKDDNSKKIIKEFQILEFISIILCYHCQSNGLSGETESCFSRAFSYISKSMVLFLDYILSKISSKNNVWVNKLKDLVHSKLEIVPLSKDENMVVILYNNSNLININKQLILKYNFNNEEHMNLILNFINCPSDASLLILNDIFRNKILKFKNVNKSVLASAINNKIEIKEKETNLDNSTNLKPYKKSKTINKIGSVIKQVDTKSSNNNLTNKSDYNSTSISNLVNETEKIKEIKSKYSQKTYTMSKIQDSEETIVESNPINSKRRKSLNEIKSNTLVIDDSSNVNNDNKAKDNLINQKLEILTATNINNGLINECEKNQKESILINEVIDEKTNVLDVLKICSEMEIEKNNIHNQNHNLFNPVFPYIDNKKNPLNKKFSIVLDLDETLIHYKEDDKDPTTGEIRMRPYLFKFLENIQKYYEIIMFTAATQDVS